MNLCAFICFLSCELLQLACAWVYTVLLQCRRTSVFVGEKWAWSSWSRHAFQWWCWRVCIAGGGRGYCWDWQVTWSASDVTLLSTQSQPAMLHYE